jgi:aspartate racemase
MHTLGIVGGIGPESTIDYYRQLVARLEARAGPAGPPDILINSLQVRRMVALATAGDWDAVTRYLAAALDALSRAGATVGLIAANTPHVVFDAVAATSPIPLVSIVVATRDAAQARGLRRLGLIGTRFTMSSRFYPDVFAAKGLEIVAPAPADLEYVHGKYVGELLQNQFLPETRDEVVRVIERMRQHDAIDGIIFGGTELPLLLRGATDPAFPVLDTTQIHVEAAVDRVLGQAPIAPA